MWSLCCAKKYFGTDSYRLPPQDEKKTKSLPYLASEHRFLEFGISIEFHTPISILIPANTKYFPTIVYLFIHGIVIIFRNVWLMCY